MQKIEFKNLPSKETPISAENLNIMQDNIEDAIITTEATTTANGLMSSSDKTKLNGISTGANKYVLPTASSTLGGVKTTSTVTSNSGYTACPIIGGIPYYKDTNTTYSTATTSVNGLMSSSDKTKLNGIATGATKNTVENILTSTNTANALSAAQGKILNDRFTYSTSEQVIGKWIDGKNIYRKVITVANPAHQTWTNLAQISNLNEIISIKGIIKTSTKHVPLFDTSSTGGGTLSKVQVENSKPQYYIGLSGVTKLTMILEYTKTTG